MNKRIARRLASVLNNSSEYECLLASVGLEFLSGQSMSYADYDRLALSPKKINIRKILRGVEMAVGVLSSKITLDLIGGELEHVQCDAESGCVIVNFDNLSEKYQLLLSMAFDLLDNYVFILAGAQEMGFTMPSIYTDKVECIPYHRLTNINIARRLRLTYIEEDSQYLFPWYATYSEEEYDQVRFDSNAISAWQSDAEADKNFAEMSKFLEYVFPM